MKSVNFYTAIALALAIAPSVGQAQQPVPVPLSAYVDANGFIDVQALTCAQLAGTFQEDADALMAWYSGWYNGLAKKHFAHPARAKELEHQTIVYCKENRSKKVIEAMAVVFKDEKIKEGIAMK